MKTILFILLFFLSSIMQAKAERYDVVGTDLPPLMYLKNGKPEGFYVDILRLMVQDLKHTDIRIRFYPAPRMFKILSKNRKTFSLGITRNEKREHLYKWVGPIYPRIFALFKLKNRPDIQVKKLEDVRSYRVGVGRGYAAVNDLLKAGVPEKNIDEAVNDSQNVKKLFAKRIDFVIMNDVMLAYLLKKEGYVWNDVERAIILNDQYDFWYAFNKSIDDSIIQKFQHSLDQLKQDGRYDNIVKKYF